MKKWVLLFVMSSLGVGPSVMADEAESLETLSVTATREERATLDTPASIDVKTRDEIELDAPAYQRELLNSIPGVRINQTGSSLGHMTSIRMPTNTGPYYLFLQDGIPVQSSGFFNHNGLVYTNFGSAGSAEVLRGAGTALYGSDAVAATINIRSDDPSLYKGTRMGGELGSDDFYKLSLAHGGTLANDDDLGFSVSHTGNGGWRDHTRYTRQELNITHFTMLNDATSLKTVLLANRSDAEMAGSLIGRDALDKHPESVGNIAGILARGEDPRRKFDFARLSTEMTYDLSAESRIDTIFYLRYNRNRYVATWERNLPQNDSKEKTLGVMLKGDLRKGGMRSIYGVDLEYTRASRAYVQLFDYQPSGRGAPVAAGDIYNYDVDYLAVAPYARLEYPLSDRLALTAGLRYDTNRFNYTNNLSDGRYGASTYARVSSDKDFTFHHLSPKLALSYHFSKDRMAYLRYANGFRIPQATRLYSVRTNTADFSLDPETTDTYELGYKQASKRFSVDIALYYMTIDDSIVRRENADGDRFYVNGGKTLHRGIELGVNARLSETFSMRVAYSYSKHEFDNDAVYGNNEQAAAPNDIANVRLIYRPRGLQGLTALLEWEHVGDYWLDDGNTRKYEGYDIGNLKILYQPDKHLTLFGKLNNLSDETYAESATQSFGRERYTPGAPRQFFAGIEYRW